MTVSELIEALALLPPKAKVRLASSTDDTFEIMSIYDTTYDKFEAPPRGVWIDIVQSRNRR